MKLLLAAAALLAACRGAAPVSPAPSTNGPIIEIQESLACPLPASRVLVTIARDGKAERVVFEGLEHEPVQTKSTREKMTLSAKDAEELFRLFADSKWETLPEKPDEWALQGRPACVDCCSGALYIKTAAGGRSLSFPPDRRPAYLEKLMTGFDEVLARGTWERVVYPWETQRGP